jgi:hypothetical protein
MVARQKSAHGPSQAGEAHGADGRRAPQRHHEVVHQHLLPRLGERVVALEDEIRVDLACDQHLLHGKKETER